ncbi:MAG: guanine deaminase [Rhodobacteraceae bacterium]|nr:guanine deaminase [Paracoccaceae bacterium]
MNDKTILRGRLLSFRREPENADDTAAFSYIEDGALVMAGGMILSVGAYADLGSDVRQAASIIDHRPHLILPGFIDAHLHFPQMHAVASWGAQLMEWLNTYTFPQEARFAELAHAERMAGWFLDQLVSQGTTTVAAYCSVHSTSATALFQAAMQRNYRLIAGKALMDRNAPDAVLDTPQLGYDETRSLIARWHGQGRIDYAITPRFAITSTPEQMETVAALIAEHPDCYVQTHLNENHYEIELTLSLYPKARDYLDIYEAYGMLGPKSLFGHSIHMNQRERAAMAASGSVAVFCPTSNLFLGSGLFDEAAMKSASVRTAIATDIGGGTDYSMLRTLDEAYKVLQLQNQKLDPYRAFYWLTLGNARALSKQAEIGTLEVGTEADVVVLNSAATPQMAMRMETVTSLREELFVLQTFGDDRAIAETYVSGKAAKNRSLTS